MEWKTWKTKTGKPGKSMEGLVMDGGFAAIMDVVLDQSMSNWTH